MNFTSKIKNSIDDVIWEEFQRVKNCMLNKTATNIEQEFYSRFRHWDKSDCSIVGLLTVILWYVSSIENSDPWRNNEYEHLIETIKNFSF